GGEGTGVRALDPHDDHRMAMAFAVLGLKRGGISIVHPDCVAKSYPQFFADLEHIRFAAKPIAVVGMRGAGKSNLARRLASRLTLHCTDVDKIFEEKHGPIKEFVALKGWPAFRSEEERLVREALKPGHVVSLGGGACESAATRKFLKDHATVVWIQTTK